MTDPLRPLEDPADVTSNNKCHPDKPTEPPNKPEGTGWQDGKWSIEKVKSRKREVSRVSIKGTEAVDDNSDEECQPRKPNEPPYRLQVKSTDPVDVQVEPGGKTNTE